MLNVFIFFKTNLFILSILIFNFIFSNFIQFTSFFFFLNKFNFLLFFLCVLTFFFIFFLNKYFFLKNFYIFLFYFIFLVILFFLTNTNSFLVFFITYESLLIISAFLFKITSQNKRSSAVIFYFIFWTQLGSFFVFLGFVYVYSLTNSLYFFFIKNFYFSKPQNNLIFFLFLIGFGIKLPIWPFSFWLSKTHVEASTSFSIFLSSVLLKTACVGLLKLNFFFKNNLFFFFLIFLSFVFSSFSLIIQVDFKKLIAYLTIQEMSILTFLIVYQDFTNHSIVNLFITLHILTTIQFFFINDIIFKKFLTRQTSTFLGLLNSTPKLCFFFLCLFFLVTGMPFFIKFFIEFFILIKFINTCFAFLFLFVYFILYFSIIFFSKSVLTFFFGKKKNLVFDISFLDSSMFFINFFILFIFIFYMLKFNIYH